MACITKHKAETNGNGPFFGMNQVISGWDQKLLTRFFKINDRAYFCVVNRANVSESGYRVTPSCYGIC